MKPTLTANTVQGFVKKYLWTKYDNAVDSPKFHKEVWGICLSGASRVGIAAPREHAKSTSVTHTVTLFMFLFRLKKYGLVVSDTLEQASLFLGDIKNELIENEALRRDFGIRCLVKDAVTDIIVEFQDGAQFRIQALGSEQKVRGRKWRNSRPDYIVGDDLENDEIVENDDRRKKFRDWFYKALVPALGKKGMIVIVGTILHMDSLLMRIMKNKSWTTRLYKAHKDFDDFSEILWPEYHTEESLRSKRQAFIDDGNSEGYSQEYLNDPTANNDAFFKKEDFRELDEEMRVRPTVNYAAIDLAISDADKSAFTVIVVGGLDDAKRLLIKQVIRFRGDANDIINEMFEVQRLYNISMWKVEKGQISHTLMGPLVDRMNATGNYLNLVMGTPTKDKRSRARGIQAMMRAGGVYFDKKAPWFPAFEQELIQFPKGMYKDQVDAIAWLGIAIHELNEGPTTFEVEEEEYERRRDEVSEFLPTGRSTITGY